MTPTDITRCADGLAGQCPQAGRCERTAPVPDGETVRQAFNNWQWAARGWCAEFVPVLTECEENE